MKAAVNNCLGRKPKFTGFINQLPQHIIYKPMKFACLAHIFFFFHMALVRF
jgi:hypothetical protein